MARGDWCIPRYIRAIGSKTTGRADSLREGYVLTVGTTLPSLPPSVARFLFSLVEAIRAFPALPVGGFDGRAPRRPFPGAGVLLAGSSGFPRPRQEDGGGEKAAIFCCFMLFPQPMLGKARWSLSSPQPCWEHNGVVVLPIDLPPVRACLPAPPCVRSPASDELTPFLGGANPTRLRGRDGAGLHDQPEG